MYYNEKHAKVVEQRGDNYQYIGSYKRNEILNNGNVAKESYMRVKCPYCGTEYDVSKRGFEHGSKCDYCCNEYKNSFAYHIEIELNLKLEDVWDFKKNTLNPYYIYKNSRHKVWIKCINLELNPINKLRKKDYHPSHTMYCYKFTSGRRCPYCTKRKGFVHKYDSFGYLYPDKAKYWDYNKNDKSPFEVAPITADKYWFRCKNCNTIFKRSLSKINRSDKISRMLCVRCSKATSKLEESTMAFLDKNNIEYIHQKKYNGLIGLGGYKLSYDFYLPSYNMLIECQGEFHDGTAYHQTQEGYLIQQEHDKRKQEYAKIHKIKLLEIWYWDYENINEILIKELIK